MTARQFILSLVVLFLAGLAGGALSQRLAPIPAQAQAGPAAPLTVSELRLVDEAGKTRALLSLLRGKPRLIMTDELGEFRMELGLGAEGGSGIWLRDAEGRIRLVLADGPAGDPSLTLRDQEGRKRASVYLGASGGPALIMRDDASRDRVALWQEKDEMGLALADASGQPRAGLVIKQDQKPTLAFYGPDRRVVWYAPDSR